MKKPQYRKEAKFTRETMPFYDVFQGRVEMDGRRGGRGRGGRVSPIKNNLPSRLVDKVYAVDNIIVLTESWALVNVIQHDYITGNLKNPRPSVKTSNLPVPRVDYLIVYRSIYRCYRIYIFISYIYTVCISVSTNN